MKDEQLRLADRVALRIEEAAATLGVAAGGAAGEGEDS